PQGTVAPGRPTADRRDERAVGPLLVPNQLRKIVLRVLEGDAVVVAPRHRELGRRPPVWLRDVHEATAALDDAEKLELRELAVGDRPRHREHRPAGRRG